MKLAQIEVTPGGWFDGRWMTKAELVACEDRWALRSYRTQNQLRHDEAIQCGGCYYFAAAGNDYGLCCCESSPHDGCVVFEHGGCWCHKTGTEMKKIKEACKCTKKRSKN